MDYNPDQCPVCEGPMKDWRAVEMSTWQPIETAPKDGRPILAYGHIALSNHAIGVVVWSETYGLWDAENDPDQGPWDSKPTHWMPLPEPPTASEARQTGSVEP